MGAGNCPEDTEAQLLQEVLKLNLGFSETQLFSAIKHLVKEFGSLEDTPSWIRQDNFTILVNYILDNEVTQQRPLSRSSVAPASTEQFKKSRGAKPLPLTREEVPNGKSLPRDPLPRKATSLIEKIDPQKGASPQQKGRMDRQVLRSHFREKLTTNCVKANQGSSTDCKTSEVQNSTTASPQANAGDIHGRAITNNKTTSLLDQAEHLVRMVPKVTPLQRSNVEPRNENQGTTKKRGHGLNGFVGISQKKNKSLELVEKALWETRASMSSGCHDLATVPQSCQDVRVDTDFTGNRKLSGQSLAENEAFRNEVVNKPRVERKPSANGNCAAIEKQRVFVDLERSENICSYSNNPKNKLSSLTNKGDMTEMLSSSGGQKASCSSLHKTEAEVGPDLMSQDIDSHLLNELEDFLKEGNCQRALEIVRACKDKRQKVGAMQVKANLVEGEQQELVPDIPGRKKGFVVSLDISRGLEKLPISCVNEYNTNILPDNFLYVTRSVIRQAAHVDLSFSRIGDLHCSCSDDCLRSSGACKCTDSTRGEYAYNENGQLIDRLAFNFVSGCRTIQGDFITECCDKCRCSMNCGNRIVQRGITRKLQVFMTQRKGWGVRALEKIPARAFLFEYLGEIATNLEQFERNLEYAKNGVYTYVMNLDADLDMEQKHFKEGLKDHEALVLDATIFGNVSRFVNHRCNDANLFMRPVQIETRDTHYYHAALFAARDIEEMEELTWDYGIDFDDDTHLLKAFKCHCKSLSCRDASSRLEYGKKGRLVKSIRSKQH